MTNNKTRLLTAVYIRVSTKEQNEAGQKLKITEWLEGQGIDPDRVRWYSDVHTRDNFDRPDFQRLQKDIFAGKVGTVVIWKLDRLSGSMIEGINVLCDWVDRGIRVVSVTQQIDLSNTVGKMIAAVLLAVAEMEQETRRDRQAAGIAASPPGTFKGRKPGTLKRKPDRAKELAEKGNTHAEIAAAMEISQRTVARYLAGS